MNANCNSIKDRLDAAIRCIFAGLIFMFLPTGALAATIEAYAVDAGFEGSGNPFHEVLARSSTDFEVVANPPETEGSQMAANQDGALSGLVNDYGNLGKHEARWIETVSNNEAANTENTFSFGTGELAFLAQGVWFADGSSLFGLRTEAYATYDVLVNGVEVWKSGLAILSKATAPQDGSSTDPFDYFDIIQEGVSVSGGFKDVGPFPAHNITDASGVVFRASSSYLQDAADFSLDLGELAPGESLEVELRLNLATTFSCLGNDPSCSSGATFTPVLYAGDFFDASLSPSYARVDSRIVDGPAPVPLPGASIFLVSGLIVLGFRSGLKERLA